MSLSSFKRSIQKNKLFKSGYYWLKARHDKRIEDNKFRYKGQFIDRSKGSDKLCIVLAGYKDYLSDSVFGRIKAFIPADIDVCVITSGLFSDVISKMCEENGWSYLSTKENNVCLVQNIAIKSHPSAKYIFKLDEDIFVTKGFFEKMMEAFLKEKTGDYRVGVLAPLLPVNGYGHLKILKELNLVDKYTELFERPVYAAGADRKIESDPESAKFFWGQDGYVPSIDKLNEMFASKPVTCSPCSIRFSIGAILFERETIEDMGYFTVERDISGMAQDEIELCSYCMLKSRPILVCENTVVGHFSFGPQTAGMKEYYSQNKEKFNIC